MSISPNKMHVNSFQTPSLCLLIPETDMLFEVFDKCLQKTISRTMGIITNLSLGKSTINGPFVSLGQRFPSPWPWRPVARCGLRNGTGGTR